MSIAAMAAIRVLCGAALLKRNDEQLLARDVKLYSSSCCSSSALQNKPFDLVWP